MDFDVKNLITQIKDARNRNIVVVVTAAAVILLVDIFLILPPLTALNFRLKDQIVFLKKDVDVLKRHVTDVSAIKNGLEAVRNEQKEYEKRLHREEEVPVLLGGISAIAGKIGVEMIAVRPVKLETSGKPPESDTIFHAALVEIFAKGGYHQIGQFINKLESLDKFVEIKDIEITADKAAPRRHFFRLLVATYMLKT